ncbi:MAG: type II toxin-antitoxin system prevent-host-death family antitoxin [Planctomycetes bacterium]|jgi:prevent-host-death family protein|nr:type II toxin-antitoxin system prevent-host-death family antitoxin [Planctomycetota bacterium]
MASISVQDLKQTLADILRRVGLGEWITIHKHGKPVAKLGPICEAGVHVGPRFDTDVRIIPFGRRLSGGAYLSALADDRGGDDR